MKRFAVIGLGNFGFYAAKALDDDQGKILKRVGATEVIHPEKEMALRISRSLSHPNSSC